MNRTSRNPDKLISQRSAEGRDSFQSRRL